MHCNELGGRLINFPANNGFKGVGYREGLIVICNWVLWDLAKLAEKPATCLLFSEISTTKLCALKMCASGMGVCTSEVFCFS